MEQMSGPDTAIRRMTEEICAILGEDIPPSIYLHGSAAIGDFRPGWSDIDLLVLTGEPIPEDRALGLRGLRQALGDPVYRAFEGGMLSLDAFLTEIPDRVVYWGTSGERIAEKYDFNSLSRMDLLDHGILLCGREVRDRISRPTEAERRRDIAAHLETIRKYARFTGRSLYAFGWLLDISRCLYTLRTGRIIGKTAAGEWALESGLCPEPEALGYALTVRRSPIEYRDRAETLDRAEALDPAVQRYADVLEQELQVMQLPKAPS